MNEIRSRQTASVVLLAVLMALVAIIHETYRFGVSDQAITLPIARELISPGFHHPNDLISEVAPHYYSIVWPIAGYVLRLDTTLYLWMFFVAYIGLRTLTLLAVYKLAEAFGVSPSVRFVAMGLLAFNHFVSGPGGLYQGDFLSSQAVSLPIIIYGIYLIVDRRFVAGYFVLGVAANFHVMSSAHAVVGVSIFSLALWWTGGRDRQTLLRVPAAFLLGASVIIGWMVVSTGVGNPIGAPTDWLPIVEARDSYIFPSLWGFWGDRGIGHGLLGLFFLIVVVPIFLHSGVRNKLWLWVASTTPLFLIAVVTVEISPLTTAIAFQPFRGVYQLWIVAGLALAMFIVWVWNRQQDVVARGLVVSLGLAFATDSSTATYVMLMGGLIFWTYVSALRFVWDQGRWTASEIRNSKGLLALSLGAAFVFAILYADSRTIASSSRYLGLILLNRRELGILAFEVILPSILLVAFIRPAGRLAWDRSVKFVSTARLYPVVLSILAVSVGVFMVDRNLDLQFSEFKPNAGLHSVDTSADDLDIQLWARDNTPEGTLFLTPNGSMGDFRIVSERSSYVDKKIGALSSFDVDFAYEWQERTDIILREMNGTLADLNRFAGEIDAGYAIFWSTPEQRFETLPDYRNDTYEVFSLPIPR